MSDQTTTPAAEGGSADLPNGLPPVRENLVAQAERVHQEILHERDLLRRSLAESQTENAGLRAQLSVAELESSQMRSRGESLAAIRDEAIARRAEVEAVLSAMLAIGRAFQITTTPLIRPAAEEEAYAENLNREYDPLVDLHRDGGRQ